MLEGRGNGRGIPHKTDLQTIRGVIAKGDDDVDRRSLEIVTHGNSQTWEILHWKCSHKKHDMKMESRIRYGLHWKYLRTYRQNNASIIYRKQPDKYEYLYLAYPNLRLSDHIPYIGTRLMVPPEECFNHPNTFSTACTVHITLIFGLTISEGRL